MIKLILAGLLAANALASFALSEFVPLRSVRVVNDLHTIGDSVNAKSNYCYKRFLENIFVKNAPVNEEFRWRAGGGEFESTEFILFFRRHHQAVTEMTGQIYRHSDFHLLCKNAIVRMDNYCRSFADVGGREVVDSFIYFLDGWGHERAFSAPERFNAVVGSLCSTRSGERCPCCKHDRYNNSANFNGGNSHRKSGQAIRFLDRLNSRPLSAKIGIALCLGGLAAGLVGLGSYLAIFHRFWEARVSGGLIFVIGIGLFLSSVEYVITSG